MMPQVINTQGCFEKFDDLDLDVACIKVVVNRWVGFLPLNGMKILYFNVFEVVAVFKSCGNRGYFVLNYLAPQTTRF